MRKIDRSIRVCTIAEIHERHMLGGYMNIEPAQIDTERQKTLIDGILNNAPIHPIVLVSYDDPKSSKLKYFVVSGKEIIEMVLDFIIRNEKPGPLRFDIDGLTKQEKDDFWSYQLSQHYISTELTESEIEEIESFYRSL